jgi:hypothetical protein
MQRLQQVIEKYEPFKSLYAQSQRDGKEFEDVLQQYASG